MFLSPSSLLFIGIVSLSTLIIISSSSFIACWIALELNSISFIPLIITSSGQEQRKSAVTYFLTQTLGSVFFIISALIIEVGELVPISITLVCASVRLFIKIGAAPFHAWLPRVVQGLSWRSLFLLFTIQKINPFLILGALPSNRSFLLRIALVSVCIGGIIGLTQTQTRIILVFSSVNHVGWIITAITLRVDLFFTYFIIYLLLLLPLIFIFSNFNLWHLNQTSSLPISRSNQLLVFSSLLSLGGLPPFIGFLPKWTVLQNVIDSHLFLAGAILVFTSLLTLFYYLRLTISSFTLSKNIIYPSLPRRSINSVLVGLLVITLLGLPIVILI